MKYFFGVLVAVVGFNFSPAVACPYGPDPRDPAQRAEPAASRKIAPASPEGEKSGAPAGDIAPKAPSQVSGKN